MTGGRRNSGQASSEYAALVFLVAVILGSAAALTSGGLGISVETAISRGICSVTSRSCPRLHAAAIPPDLAACTLARKAASHDFSIDVGVVRLASQMGMTVERMSDGRVRVSFADSARVGAGDSVGLHFRLGHVGGKVEASVNGGLALTAGRVWVFPEARSAERFIARFGEGQRLPGRFKHGVETVCPICGRLIGAPATPQKPDERWISGGLAAGATVSAGISPVGADLDVALRGAVGRRVSRAGTAWIVRLDDRITGVIDALGGGLEDQFDGVALASIDLDRSGAPIRLSVTSERRIVTRRGLRLPLRLRQLIGDAGASAGEAVDSESVLELRSQADRHAAVRFIAAARGLDPAATVAAARNLGTALRDHGSLTVRRWRLAHRFSGLGAGGALGLRLGADVNSLTDDQRLASVATRIGGLGWLPRADCLPV